MCKCSLRLCPACQHPASTKPPHFFIMYVYGVDLVCEIIVSWKGGHKNPNDITASTVNS